MATPLHKVRKAQKEVGACEWCLNRITPGSSYIWWRNRGSIHRRCREPECLPSVEEIADPRFATSVKRLRDQDLHKARVNLIQIEGVLTSRISSTPKQFVGTSGWEENVDKLTWTREGLKILEDTGIEALREHTRKILP